LNLDNVNKVFFLGIGGIGMSALARYFLFLGKEVYGYDKTPTKLTKELEKEGANIHFEDDVALLPEGIDIVVYTPAIPKDHKEFNYFKKNKFNLYKRSQILGEISKNYFTIAVAGTHGKTTTSGMIAHFLTECGVPIVGFLGGIIKNFNSNFVIHPNAKVLVTEADEFDRSFLTLHPNIAIITSLDPDHLDIYGSKEEMVKSYREFALQVKEKIILHKSVEEDLVTIKNVSSYSTNTNNAEVTSANIRVENGKQVFDIINGFEKIENIKCGLPGKHNIENAIGAFIATNQYVKNPEKVAKAIETYKGVVRRFDVHYQSSKTIYIDDYAHHPREIQALVNSVKELYPNKKITGIFQPHLFSRTRDFADDFAESLSLLDELIMLEIYPAREQSIPGVTSSFVLEKVAIYEKQIVPMEKVLDYIKEKEFEVLLTIGAGNIDQLIDPIKNMLQLAYEEN